MKIKYRKLLPNESKEYRNLRLESLQLYPMSFGSNYEEQVTREKLFFEKVIEDSLPDKFIFGAFDDKQLIGICGFFRDREKSNRHIGTIVQMYVKKEYQGKGIGQALLRKTIAKGFDVAAIEQIDLSVLTHQRQVNQVYEKVGFKEYGFREKALKRNGVYQDERFMVFYKVDYLRAR